MGFDGALFQKVPRLRSLQDISGSTMVASIVTSKHVILANLGDSRAVIARGGRVVRATEDHKPQSAKESTRVIEAGGYIMMGRVCGNLAVSAAVSFGNPICCIAHTERVPHAHSEVTCLNY